MMKQKGLLPLGFFAILFSALPAYGAGKVTLSESMSLAEVAAALESYPPSWQFGDERAKIMASLDRLIGSFGGSDFVLVLHVRQNDGFPRFWQTLAVSHLP